MVCVRKDEKKRPNSSSQPVGEGVGEDERGDNVQKRRICEPSDSPFRYVDILVRTKKQQQRRYTECIR